MDGRREVSGELGMRERGRRVGNRGRRKVVDEREMARE